MKLLSPITSSLLGLLPQDFYWKIPYGAIKGGLGCFRSENPGQSFGRYENDIEAEFTKLISQSSVFWDIRANAGWFSLMSAKLSSTLKIIAMFIICPRLSKTRPMQREISFLGLSI